jgi:hypothetical protein
VSGNRELTYTLDLGAPGMGQPENIAASSGEPARGEVAGSAVPRIARLVALAIRFERLVREERVQDYAELARLGKVTRARMTQIMKLLDLAPDIQEQLLFLPPVRGLTERSLRPVVTEIDWREQRRLFQKITDRSDAHTLISGSPVRVPSLRRSQPLKA